MKTTIQTIALLCCIATVSCYNTIGSYLPVNSFPSERRRIDQLQEFLASTDLENLRERHEVPAGDAARHVYVETIRKYEPRVTTVTPTRVPKGVPELANMIFVKMPTPPTTQFVIEIPDRSGNQRQDIIYVLLKKMEDTPQVKFSGPPPTQPPKPSVYFLQYNPIRNVGQPPTNKFHPFKPELSSNSLGTFI